MLTQSPLLSPSLTRKRRNPDGQVLGVCLGGGEERDVGEDAAVIGDVDWREGGDVGGGKDYGVGVGGGGGGRH